MRKRRLNPQVDAEQETQPYNPDEDVLEGETPDEWMARKDADEGRKHDQNESRHEQIPEDYDPNMGCL